MGMREKKLLLTFIRSSVHESMSNGKWKEFLKRYVVADDISEPLDKIHEFLNRAPDFLCCLSPPIEKLVWIKSSIHCVRGPNEVESS